MGSHILGVPMKSMDTEFDPFLKSPKYHFLKIFSLNPPKLSTIIAMLKLISQVLPILSTVFGVCTGELSNFGVRLCYFRPYPKLPLGR